MSSLRLAPALGRRARIGSLWILSLAGLYCCSVFPDQAQLPGASSAAGIGGDASSSPGPGGAGIDEPLSGAGASEGGAPGVVGGTNGATGGTTAATGGTTGATGGTTGATGGTTGATGGTAGATSGTTGVGGAAGTAGGPPADCPDPQQQRVPVTIDTWIESAKPNAGHGSDQLLSVVGGGDERRALLQLALPPVLPGTVVLKATLVLSLQTDADVRLLQRSLSVHRLNQEISEARTTWTSWGQGNRDWSLPGGDFGPALAHATLPPGTSAGTLTFDLTAAVRASSSSQAVPFALIILETSAPPPPPAELAFTSRQGDASSVPTLIFDYCPP